MNKTKIEWCDYTWNPVVGCKTGCYYCYAERMNKRFKWIKNWEKPEFFLERLYDPLDKKGVKIFVGSMCDLFGGWVSSNWIQQIIDVCWRATQHEYMFLTKHPSRYNMFKFPENSWLGATIEEQHKVHRLHDLESYKNTLVKKFVSIEPLMGDFWDTQFDRMDLVIIGAMTGLKAIKPEDNWIKSIRHKNIFYKENIKQYL